MGVNLEGINPRQLTTAQHIARARGLDDPGASPGQLGLPSYAESRCESVRGCREPGDYLVVTERAALRDCFEHGVRVLSDVQAVKARGLRKINLEPEYYS